MKGDFSTQSNLRTPEPVRLKNGHNVTIGHTNHTLPRHKTAILSMNFDG